MKKVLIFITLIFLVTGCGRSVESNSSSSVDKSTTKEVDVTTKKHSDIFNNFSNFVKNEMINKKIIDESNLKSFQVISIYKNGYYKENPSKFHYQINFKYACNDNSYDCVDYLYIKKSNSNGQDYSVIWVYGNEEIIDKFSSGISINMNDNYIVVGETIE